MSTPGRRSKPYDATAEADVHRPHHAPKHRKPTAVDQFRALEAHMARLAKAIGGGPR